MKAMFLLHLEQPKMREAVVRAINKVILALRRKKSAFWMVRIRSSPLTVARSNFTRCVELVQ